jgi:3'-phosphoadenosine 5'-phosphosulfate sulfotransferase (PAPS reductase)/FAD synthetase
VNEKTLSLFEVLPEGHPLRGTTLDLTPEDVAGLTARQREWRVLDLMGLAVDLLDYAAETLGEGRLVARVGLFSGGNDSTVMMHLLHSLGSDYITHAGHANTGIGIEQTRQFVRDCCKTWGVPLIEKHPRPEDSYRAQVLSHGFPGEPRHRVMYTRLKERAVEAMVRDIKGAYRDRVMLIAGRRRSESARRANVPEMERRGAQVWVSPLVLWTALDMNTYREMYDVPRNEVSDHIHMSGECLCGAFAERGELDMIAMFYPEVAADIRALEDEVRAAGIREPMCRWGWGAYFPTKDVGPTGPMCSACDNRMQLRLDDGDAA